MSQDCPKDLVRSLVEGTLDVAGSHDGSAADQRASVLAHLEACASCRKLQSKLERNERLVRAALETAGDTDADSECPSPADLAAWTEHALEEDARAKIEEHVARCALCRGSSAIASSPAVLSAFEKGDVPETALDAVRRRVALARAESADAQMSKLTASGRRRSQRTTGRYAAVPASPIAGLGMGFWIAAAAALLVAVGLIAFRETTTVEAPVAEKPSAPTPVVPPAPPSTRESPAPRDPREAPPIAPRETPSPDTRTPAETPAESPVVDQNPPEAEPEEDDGRHAPRGVGAPKTGGPDIARRPDPKGPDPKGPDEKQPKDVVGRQDGGPKRTDEPVLACAVEGLSGPIEVKKKDGKWHALAAGDLLHAGDSLRAKGNDASLTVASRAKVQLDGDTVGTVAFTRTGVKLTIESGGLGFDHLVLAAGAGKPTVTGRDQGTAPFLVARTVGAGAKKVATRSANTALASPDVEPTSVHWLRRCAPAGLGQRADGAGRDIPLSDGIHEGLRPK
ncbi:hypothetical protein HY251_00770 [bacterium]|nr:hypothetical protein [bacterium]